MDFFFVLHLTIYLHSFSVAENHVSFSLDVMIVIATKMRFASCANKKDINRHIVQIVGDVTTQQFVFN